MIRMGKGAVPEPSDRERKQERKRGSSHFLSHAYCVGLQVVYSSQVSVNE